MFNQVYHSSTCLRHSVSPVPLALFRLIFDPGVLGAILSATPINVGFLAALGTDLSMRPGLFVVVSDLDSVCSSISFLWCHFSILLFRFCARLPRAMLVLDCINLWQDLRLDLVPFLGGAIGHYGIQPFQGHLAEFLDGRFAEVAAGVRAVEVN